MVASFTDSFSLASARLDAGRPMIGHINLMTDTLISNASAQDLRAIVRSLLATGPPSTSSAFCAVARARLTSNSRPLPHPSSLFISSSQKLAIPTPLLPDHLARARSLFGAGMGIESLELLSCVVRATIGLRWHPEGKMAESLCVVDGDIAQGIQACREEVAAGMIKDFQFARKALESLKLALKDSQKDVEIWNGEYPFERGLANLECFTLL